MNLHILHDSNGNNSRVYIPSKNWELNNQNYPDIESIEEDLPHWQKEILDNRMEQIKNKHNRLKPLEQLYVILNKRRDEL